MKKYFLIIIICFSYLNLFSEKKPKLVVGIVVDQMRFDFIEKGTHYGASIYELKFNGKFFTELYSDTVTSEVVPSTSSPIKAPQRVLPKKPKDIAPKSEKQQKPEVQKIKSTDKHIYI